MNSSDKRKSQCDHLNHSVVVEDFFGKGKHLEKHQLGWDDYAKMEAQSSVSKKIFNFYVEEARLNMVFYYLGDGNFYGIHSELAPAPVFRFKKMPNAKSIYGELGMQDTHDFRDGEILYWVNLDQRFWDVVKIGGKDMEEVIENSYIVNIS
ncbi:MAG: hypothetical protein NC548_56235 [Lachnospiraceae bacterium]|nr:hypothetical protein [Lachnospiraceae bacterium]